jgi:TetR/AcrR family transcriptional repressor of nem operon
MSTKGQETRSRIIQTSRKIFTRQGFQNTSISEIIAATGVKKGNLYYHFTSKEELGIAVLTDARDEFFSILDESFTGKKPEDRIINSCNSIALLMQQTNFVGGCLFGNTALEMTDANSRFGIIVREVFSRWTDVIAKELRQITTTSTNRLDPHILATSIVAILEGGIMLSRVYNEKSYLDNCITVIKKHIYG